MKLPFALLCVLALALSGCTDAGDGDIDAPSYSGPKAELWHTDVPLAGSEQQGVDCYEQTHLYVEYIEADEPSGSNESSDFVVNVYSESSLQKTDDEGNPVYSGIAIFPAEGDPQSFPGDSSGTYETDLSGTAGTWVLEVHRSDFHVGQFIVRLTCGHQA